MLGCPPATGRASGRAPQSAASEKKRRTTVLNPVVHPTLAETSWPVHSSFAGGAGVAAGAENARVGRVSGAGGWTLPLPLPRAVCPWPQEGQALLSAASRAHPRRPSATVRCVRSGSHAASLLARGLDGLLLVPVVLDVRDLGVAHGDELEGEGLLEASVFGDPVDAYNKRSLAGFDELVSSESGAAGPLGGPCLLLLEDRPGLVRPLSTRCPPPPEEAALDPAPDRVGTEESGQRTRIPRVQRRVGCLDRGDCCRPHRARVSHALSGQSRRPARDAAVPIERHDVLGKDEQHMCDSAVR